LIEIEGDVVFNENVAGVGGELGVLGLDESEAVAGGVVAKAGVESGGVELADLQGEEGGPARFAVTGHFKEHRVVEDFGKRAGVAFGAGFGETVEKEVVVLGGFPDEREDADGAAVRERPGKVGGDDGDTGTAGEGTAGEFDGAGRGAGAFAGKGPPGGTEPDAVQRDAAPEEPGGDGGLEAEMVAFTGRVKGEQAAGGGAEGDGDKRMGAEEEGGQTDAAGAKGTAESGGGIDNETRETVDGFAPADDEVLPTGLEGTDLLKHGADARSRTGSEVEDDGFALFAEETPEPVAHQRSRVR
jgi:hypothetical protein